MKKTFIIIAILFSFPFAEAQPFLGEIRMFAGNFAPRGWALCNGQLLPISTNSALFSILGTIYGGEGRTSFALPDLRGRVAVNAGNGPGLSSYRLGQKGGDERVTLIAAQMPNHTHIATVGGALTRPGTDDSGDTDDPTRAVPALSDGDVYNSDPGNANLVNMHMPGGSLTVTSANTGGNQSHNNVMPYTTVHFIIAASGTFPSR